MSTRFLLGIGLAFLLVFIAGVASVVGITTITDRSTITDVSVPDKTADSALARFVPAEGSSSPVAITQVMPDAVLDSDVVGLAAAVRLSVQADGVGKDVWANQVPVAQKLLRGACDCDQRNWLRHFVQTGQEAIAGSAQYPKSVQLLSTLRRSNADLVVSQSRH